MKIPLIDELLSSTVVQAALDQAWRKSLPDSPNFRHEEGGWIFMDCQTGEIAAHSAPSGEKSILDLNDPPVLDGAVIIATFHTHPNPISEGWNPAPSAADEKSAFLLGVPCIIRAENGVYTTGPISRRGGLTSRTPFPA